MLSVVGAVGSAPCIAASSVFNAVIWVGSVVVNSSCCICAARALRSACVVTHAPRTSMMLPLLSTTTIWMTGITVLVAWLTSAVTLVDPGLARLVVASTIAVVVWVTAVSPVKPPV